MEGDYHGQDRPHGTCGKKALKLSHSHYKLSAVCGETALCSTGTELQQGKETAQAAVHECCHDIPED
jgi:hypothetical protein